jgi:hypothetical protein
MTITSTEGFAKGFVERPYTRFGGNVPVLNGFYFAFNLGQTGDTDNHINSLMMLPGGASRDLSPSADLGPSRVEDGKVQMMFRDKDPSSSRDDYFFRAAHAVLPDDAANRFQIRDVGCTGECRRPLPASVLSSPASPSVLALVGFKLFFTGNRDHHIDEVGVSFDSGDLVVEFNDKNDDDVFGYLVDFVRLSTLFQNVSTGTNSGSATNGAEFRLPIPSRAEWVIRGFHFDFADEDHHIRDVGVLRQGDTVKIIYADKNADDRFNWRIDWAHVSRPVFA